MLHCTFMTRCCFMTLAAVCVCSFSQGAFWGLMVGLVVGFIRMVLEFAYQAPSCGQPNQQPAIVADVHYLYFAIILFTITSVIIIVVSLATAPISEENVSMKHTTFINNNNRRPFSLAIKDFTVCYILNLQVFFRMVGRSFGPVKFTKKLDFCLFVYCPERRLYFFSLKTWKTIPPKCLNSMGGDTLQVVDYLKEFCFNTKDIV